MASLICRVPQHAAILSNIRVPVCPEASSTYLLRLDPCCTVTGHTLALKSILLAGITCRRKQDKKLIIQTRHRVLTQQDVMRCMWLSVAMPAFAVACAHCAVPCFQKMHGQIMTHSDQEHVVQIDLRAPEEVREFGQAPILSGAIMTTHKRKCVTILGPIEMQAETQQLPGKPAGKKPFRIHSISVLDKSRYIRTLLPRIPFSTMVTALTMQLWDSQQGKDMLIGCVPCAHRLCSQLCERAVAGVLSRAHPFCWPCD